MKNNYEKFCPFLSNAEKKIACTKDCALFSNETMFGRCVLLDLSQNIAQLSMDIATSDIQSFKDKD